MAIRAYKLRFYPTEKQKCQLAIEFGNARWIWNWALEIKQKAYKRRSKSPSSIDIDKILTKLRKVKKYSWLADSSSTCATQKLRDLDAAFSKFFRKQSKYPRFKNKHDKQSVRYKTKGTIFANGGEIAITKLGRVKPVWSRYPDSTPKTLTVSKDAVGRYFISFCVDEYIQALRQTNSSIGIDMGIKDVVVTSDGLKSGAPKFYYKNQRKLRMAQRGLSRKQKGSNRYKKQRLRVAKIHAKITDCRMDFLHKLSTKLIRENQVIAIEDLNIKGMMKNRRLSKAVADTGFYEFRRQLTYKAEWYGRTLLIADRWDATSKTCCACGHKLAKLPLSTRNWTCPDCGAEHDRDINAARNVLIFTTARSAGSHARRGCTTPETVAA